jgi:hypothetical protein
VQVVGQADHHHVGVGVLDGRAQVGGVVRHAPALGERRRPLRRARVGDLDAVQAAPAVQRHRVEVADQTGSQ